MKFFSKAYFDVLFIIGIILCLLVSVNHFAPFLSDFTCGGFSGLGLVLVLVAGTLKRNERFLKNAAVSNQDERIRIITGKASEMAMYVTMLLGAVGALVLGQFGDVGACISIALAVILVVMCLTFYLAKLHYAKTM